MPNYDGVTVWVIHGPGGFSLERLAEPHGLGLGALSLSLYLPKENRLYFETLVWFW
jgi:hypothetical protein